MKTVKFKDLPEKVQEFCSRIGYAWIGNIVDTEWLHTKADWSKATDEERLAYARWKYPNGVKFIDQQTNSPLTSAGESFSIAWFYDFNTHKWAEIIEEKEEKIVFNSGDISDSDKKEIERMLKESKTVPFIISNPEPTFKAGDEVEVRIKDWPENEWRNRIYGCFLFGSHWCRFKDDNYLFKFDEIRKPDPDKVYREIAKEIMNARYLIQETYFSNTEGSRHSFDREFLEETLIEAIKKGKEL